MTKRIKVVWLCHFINEEMNNYFRIERNEMSRWISEFIDIARKDPNIDLHIVAPNYWNNKDENFQKNGTNFHFFKYHNINITKLISLELVFRNEKNIKKKVLNLIYKIKPDVIHLFGSENLAYSSGILKFKNNDNVVISLQGFINDAKDKPSFPRVIKFEYRKKLEKAINSSFNSFTVSLRNDQEKKLVKEYPNATNIYDLNFPTTIPELQKNIIKEYEIVFWGRVCIDKGIIDLFEAILLLRRKNANIRALIIGLIEPASKQEIEEFVKINHLERNIFFSGFQKSQKELYKLAQKGKIYVFPTHFDDLPGSVRESLHLQIPVITYPVGSLPELNEKYQCVLLSPLGDVEQLSENITELLNNRHLYEELKLNGYNLAQSKFSNNEILSQLQFIYNKFKDKLC